jgi:hypothetical protein
MQALLLGGLSAGVWADASERIGMEILTAVEDERIAPGTVVVRYSGVIVFPLAENLAEAWREQHGKARRLILELNSRGGELKHAKKVIAVLKDIRAAAELKTVVRAGAICASACIPVFMQGAERQASGASAWMFHGACPAYGNIPAARPTDDYVGLLQAAGVATEFLCLLQQSGYLEKPGEFWLSGYELVHVYNANVITRLIAPWQPLEAQPAPFDPQIGPR